MKILTAAQTREADAFTISRQNLAPGELMERAALAFTDWYERHFSPARELAVFCGPGNNGGDGLALARLLHQRNYRVRLFLPQTDSHYSTDFRLNLERLPRNLPVYPFHSIAELKKFSFRDFRIIDALFGTGLSRPLQGLYAETVEFLNQTGAEIIAVDVPSGLYSDALTPEGSAVIQASRTVAFELPKLAFLLPQSGELVGNWEALPIGLDPAFLAAEHTPYHFTTAETVTDFYRPRPRFSHKGTFGHALLLAGSYGKMGAALLSTRACLRSGAGLVSTAIPHCGYIIMQTAAPEAMTIPDREEKFLARLPDDLGKYDAIGIGPGLGQEDKTGTLLNKLLEETGAPLVLDADALNLLAANKTLLEKLPPETILTPHPKEFERLTRKVSSDFERLEVLQEFCERYRCYVVLKGAYSCLGTPSGTLHFNATGNPGLATGGTGDVLTGIITALRAQHYSAETACLLGMFVHGRAGDLARNTLGETALIAGDIIAHLGAAFRELETLATPE